MVEFNVWWGRAGLSKPNIKFKEIVEACYLCLEVEEEEWEVRSVANRNVSCDLK